jgi:hypothetical protein
MKITFDEKSYDIVDCKNWRINNSIPDCSLKLDLNQCNSCTAKQSRNGDYKNPPIFVITIKNTEEKIKKEEIREPTFIEKAKSYVKAETSQMALGKVDEETFEKRKAICMSCEYRVQSHKTYKDSIGWCKGGCGCSLGNPRAALSEKLYMPTLSCPKKKFGPEIGKGFNIKDAADSVKGVAKSIVNLFEKDK